MADRKIGGGPAPPKYYGLECGYCGNRDLFVEVMRYEAHIVDGNLNYVRLAGAETDRYECCSCHRKVRPRWIRRPHELKRHR